MPQVTTADQRKPRCRHFKQCGICSLQHVEYPQQLLVKTQRSKDVISRGLGIDPAIVGDCIPSTDEYAYLNSLDLTASISDSMMTLGLPSQEPGAILPIVRCELLGHDAQAHPRSIAGALRYISNARDDLAIQMTRIRASSSGGLELSLWTHPGPFPRQIASSTLLSATRCKGLKRVIFRGAPSDEDIVVVEDLVSKAPWTTYVAGHLLQASSVSPLPPNIPITEAMIDCIFRLGWLDDPSTVLELYPGVGAFTIPIAEKVRRITTLEPFAYAYHDLVANLERAKSAAIPVPGGIGRNLSGMSDFDVIILHTDRCKLSASDWSALGTLGAGAVILISSDLTGLVQSAKAITDSGFIPAKLIPFDIRPQTLDTAVIARFLRK